MSERIDQQLYDLVAQCGRANLPFPACAGDVAKWELKSLLCAQLRWHHEASTSGDEPKHGYAQNHDEEVV